MAEWIDVKDRYPSLGAKVLVWFGDEAEPYMDVWRYKNDNPYFRPTQKFVAPRQCVTHWQALPDPPTGSRRNGGE